MRNAVCQATADSPRCRRAIASAERHCAIRAQATIATVLAARLVHSVSRSESPFGRPASVEELANVIVFMASARASYVTGTVVSVDGGASWRK